MLASSRRAARATRTAGPSRSSGTACARSPSSRAAGAARSRHRARHQRPATRRCARLAAALGSRRGGARRRGRRVRRGRAARASRAPAPHARRQRAPRCSGSRGSTRSPTSSSTCSTSTATRSWTSPTRSGGRAARPRARGGALAGAGPPRRRRGRAAGGLARPGARGHRRQAARLPLHARPPLVRRGSRSRTSPRVVRRRRLAAGGGRAHRPRSARSASAPTRTASCATRAAWARATRSPSCCAWPPARAARHRHVALHRPPAAQAGALRAPELVAEVEFVEWTRPRTLRAPSYKGIRDDISPEQVVWDPGA